MVSRVTLVQPDARHNYALARFLDNRGMLQRLYTDFAVPSGSLLARVLEPALPASLQTKLRRRYLDTVAAERIRSGFGFKLPGMEEGLTLRNFSETDLRDSDAFYLQYFAGGAKLRKRRVSQPLISDVFIVPSVEEVIEREIVRFPDWGESRLTPDQRETRARRVRDMIAQSDYLVCPSDAVLAEVSAIRSDGDARCLLIPYGASLQATTAIGPEPGRVLFCGLIGLRKGAQYIAQAAAILRETHPDITFVLAGHGNSAARAKLDQPNITLLGHLSKERMAEEFGRADVFLFPSLAEGAAGAMFEALASGLPVVATRAAGVAFTDGESGVLVPERNAEAIAGAIVRICTDRSLRAAMAASAAREAVQYGLPCWEERFVDVMTTLA